MEACLTTKELKKKHSSRLVGQAETGSLVERMHSKAVDQVGKVAAGRQDFPHSRVDKLGGTTGEQDKLCNPGFQRRKRNPQNLWL